jgi:hypothetical protein
MSTPWLRASMLAGTVDIEPIHSLEETARRLGEALSMTFEEELTGRYEEYPAFVAAAAGLEFALLGVPAPEYDVRENKSDAHQLMISSDDYGAGSGGWGHAIEVSRFFAELIRYNAGLRCEAVELPAAT